MGYEITFCETVFPCSDEAAVLGATEAAVLGATNRGRGYVTLCVGSLTVTVPPDFARRLGGTLVRAAVAAGPEEGAAGD